MRLALAAVLTALLTGSGAFLLSSSMLPDLEVRTIPWSTAAGGLRAAAPAGEVFACERDGLHRIDVAVTPLEPAGPAHLELTLRAGGPRGEVLRRAPGGAFEPYQWGGWLSFEFEPLQDSAGQGLCFQVAPAGESAATHVAPYARYRGRIGRGRWQGERTLAGPVIEGELRSEEPDLRALAFFLPKLAGPLTLTLSEAEGAGVLRRASFVPPAEVEFGWVPLSFEPIDDSRWKLYRFALELPEGAQLQADERGPCYFPFHGSGAVDARLSGMTLGDLALGDRDLIFRAWSVSGPRVAWSTLRERLGWRLWPLGLLGLAASALLGFALERAPR